ncbi:acetoin reductase [Halobacillus sp. MO56]
MSDRKVAIVTGAGGGIGRAIALRLAQDDMTVVVSDINEGAAQEVAHEIQALGKESVSFLANVSDKEQVFHLVDKVVDRYGRLDVMVANAGIVQVKPFIEISEKDMESIFRVNVFGTLYCMQAAAKQMIKQQSGKIITASSTAGKRGIEFLGHYAATKFSVIGLTQTAAKELARYGITVNAYCPGVVGTNMWKEIDQRMSEYLNVPVGETLQKRIDNIPLGRVEEPADVAKFVSYLASEDSNYMTGQAVMIDGGIVFS